MARQCLLAMRHLQMHTLVVLREVHRQETKEVGMLACGGHCLVMTVRLRREWKVYRLVLHLVVDLHHAGFEFKTAKYIVQCTTWQVCQNKQKLWSFTGQEWMLRKKITVFCSWRFHYWRTSAWSHACQIFAMFSFKASISDKWSDNDTVVWKYVCYQNFS